MRCPSGRKTRGGEHVRPEGAGESEGARRGPRALRRWRRGGVRCRLGAARRRESGRRPAAGCCAGAARGDAVARGTAQAGVRAGGDRRRRRTGDAVKGRVPEPTLTPPDATANLPDIVTPEPGSIRSERPGPKPLIERFVTNPQPDAVTVN